MHNLLLVVSSYLAKLLTFWGLWSQVQYKDKRRQIYVLMSLLSHLLVMVFYPIINQVFPLRALLRFAIEAIALIALLFLPSFTVDTLTL